jgi:phage shock protein E
MVNVVIVVLLAAVAASQIGPWLAVRWVRAPDLDRALADSPPPVVVDIRSPEEYAAGHVPGAVSVPLGRLRQATHLWSTDAPLVIVARSDYRALQGFQALRRRGFTQVRCLRGGILAYVRHRLASPSAPSQAVHDAP